MDVRRKKIAFRLLLIAIGLMPLLVVELGLRWFAAEAIEWRTAWREPLMDVSGQPLLFQRDPQNQRFELDPARSNYFQPASFLADKPSGSRRVFVLGGSTVQGRPYATETAFAKWLEIILSQADATRQYEVINVGGVSYASYRVRRILEEVLTYEPDAIVLYTGHNEFLEDRTFASQRDASTFQQTVDAIADRMATVHWLQRRLQQPIQSGVKVPSEVSARLDRAGGFNDYVRDPDWRDQVETDFQRNLDQMMQTCRRAKVPLIVCEPASDLIATPPFKSVVDPSLPERKQQQGVQWWNQVVGESSDGEKQTACTKLLELDPEHAGANYWLGRRTLESGDLQNATRLLKIARDEDVCPLRATTSMETSVREAAQRWNVPLIDVKSLLDNDRDGLPDASFFLDHVHPSISGHQRIAVAIAGVLREWDWIDEDVEEVTQFHEAFRQHLASLDEVYFQRGRQRLRGLQQWAAGRAGEEPID